MVIETEMNSDRMEVKHTNAEAPISEEHVDRQPQEDVALAGSFSKRQLKKLRKSANLSEMHKEKRQQERERAKEKRRKAAAMGLSTRTGPSRKELKRRHKTTSDAMRVVIDLDYDDIMDDKDIAKCLKQCLRIYTVNRRATRSCCVHYTGIKPNGRIHDALRKYNGYENWDVQFHFGKTYLDLFGKDEIIYLTSESDVVLGQLETNKVYIIGGLVDHNHHKGLCYERARQLDLRTARLPLAEHIDMKTRSVLSTFHVFELLMLVAQSNSWTQALLQVIPQRKGAKPKSSSDNHTVALKTNEDNDDVPPLAEIKPCD